MLHTHDHSLMLRAVAALPELLKDADGWNSLDVTYHPPHVQRVFRPFEDGHRLSLHRIWPCTAAQALLHPHSRPTDVLVVNGAYRMLVGSAPSVRAPAPVVDLTAVADPRHPFFYAMRHPNGWHAVIPTHGPVHSVMLTGPTEWTRPIPEVTRTATGTQRGLPETERRSLLSSFDGLISGLEFPADRARRDLEELVALLDE